MLEITTNTNSLVSQLENAMGLLLDVDPMLRSIATQMVPVMRVRVHVDGKDAEGNDIGNYSDAYMSVRTGIYKSNGVYKSGPNKGKQKPTGVFTKGKNKGRPRPSYNRTADRKVVLSLTRQSEQDMKAIPTQLGWGIGYSNPDNYNKMIWNEERYDKHILTKLTKEEEQNVSDISKEYVDNIVKQF